MMWRKAKNIKERVGPVLRQKTLPKSVVYAIVGMDTSLRSAQKYRKPAYEFQELKAIDSRNRIHT